jgi:lysophospholipase L1-like esterase
MSHDSADAVGDPSDETEPAQASAAGSSPTDPRIVHKRAFKGAGVAALIVMGVAGAVLAALVVLGVNVLVNALLIVAVSSLHALATALLVMFVVEVVRQLRHRRRSDFGWLALGAAGLFACIAVYAAYRVDRFVRHAHLAGGATYIYVLSVVVASLVAAALTGQLLRSDTNAFEAPAVILLEGLTGFVAGAAVVVLAAVGFASWRNMHPPKGPDLAALKPIDGIQGEYVALGDSYSAGEGLRPFNAFTGGEATGDSCHRSEQAYSQLLRFTAPAPALRFPACSGAVTHDVFNSHQHGATTIAAQVDDKVHPDVGLVTITIGGNDVVFSDVIVHCFIHANCLHKNFDPRGNNPDRDVILPPAQNLDTWAEAALHQVTTKAQTLYPHLRAIYPNARIILIGYPYLVPEGGAPILSQWNDCQSILRRFSKPERRAIRQLEDRLNQTMNETAIANNIEVISPAEGWAGHEPCGHTQSQYTNSIKPFIQFSDLGKFVDGGTFHPNAAGQRELARLVTCYLLANPEQPSRAPDAPIPGSLGQPVTCPSS